MGQDVRQTEERRSRVGSAVPVPSKADCYFFLPPVVLFETFLHLAKALRYSV